MLDPTHTTECEVIYTHAYVHADIQNTHASMPYTYTYLHSSAQRNRTQHAQTCITTAHLCEQAMWCTHSSVWSVELWASAAAMCCAPSSPIELWKRLYAHECSKSDTEQVCSDSIHTTECEIIYTRAYVHADIPNANTRARHLRSFQCTTQ
jgi:hypothetical protein